MEITGKIYNIFDTEVVSEKFKKREFVLEHYDNPAYPQLNKFTLTQDRVDAINNFQKGDVVKIEFNLKGKEWVNSQGKTIYFDTLEVWKIEKAPDSNTVDNVSTTDSIPSGPVDVSEDSEDLPF